MPPSGAVTAFQVRLTVPPAAGGRGGDRRRGQSRDRRRGGAAAGAREVGERAARGERDDRPRRRVPNRRSGPSLHPVASPLRAICSSAAWQASWLDGCSIIAIVGPAIPAEAGSTVDSAGTRSGAAELIAAGVRTKFSAAGQPGGSAAIDGGQGDDRDRDRVRVLDPHLDRLRGRAGEEVVEGADLFDREGEAGAGGSMGGSTGGSTGVRRRGGSIGGFGCGSAAGAARRRRRRVVGRRPASAPACAATRSRPPGPRCRRG